MSGFVFLGTFLADGNQPCFRCKKPIRECSGPFTTIRVSGERYLQPMCGTCEGAWMFRSLWNASGQLESEARR